ncbi:YkgJ family cysteine cluster protein [Candidatus Bathyarchaeota archaeon]|nr:YkgJ family cysteine cluster protein [Candidatus Bathyarchaeota archaeon]
MRPPLTLERKKLIKNYLKEQKIRADHPFTNEAYSFPAEDTLSFCIFYCKDTRKCLVHQVKPETCRAGPITFDINRRTRQVEWYLKTAEICALAQALHENDAAFKAHLEVAKDELLRLICTLDSRALEAILKIEEPHTVKIGEDDLPKEAKAKLGLERQSKQ